MVQSRAHRVEAGCRVTEEVEVVVEEEEVVVEEAVFIRACHQ